MLFPLKKKRVVWPWVVGIIFGLMLGAVGYVYYFFIIEHHWSSLANNPLFVNHVAEPILASGGEETASLAPLLPYLFGTESPRTILVLFANNTELRPGGGFLGVYGVIRVDHGSAQILAVDGTEVLDRGTPPTWRPTPPAPLTQYLGVDRWYFRDSNWSPDYRETVKQALTLYAGEHGPYAENIDMVVTITPTVLVELLKRIGPVTVDGVTFTADTAVEKLEYEVEYGFSRRGDTFADRKHIIDGLVNDVLHRTALDAVFHMQSYLTLAADLFSHKQIIAYATDPAVESVFERSRWAGSVTTSSVDYVGWVDANLGALKTDHAIARQLTYTITKRPDGQYEATASMMYTHTGTFDWRTSRYLTFARLYVPSGAIFLGVDGTTRAKKPIDRRDVVESDELGHHVMGVYFSIEPGESKVLTFHYLLPSSVAKAIIDHAYTLAVQKQLGTIAHGLTLHLDFGTTIIGAKPAEAKADWGDGVYTYTTDLSLDRDFRVNF